MRRRRNSGPTASNYVHGVRSKARGGRVTTTSPERPIQPMDVSSKRVRRVRRPTIRRFFMANSPERGVYHGECKEIIRGLSMRRAVRSITNYANRGRQNTSRRSHKRALTSNAMGRVNSANRNGSTREHRRRFVRGLPTRDRTQVLNGGSVRPVNRPSTFIRMRANLSNCLGDLIGGRGARSCRRKRSTLRRFFHSITSSLPRVAFSYF